MFFRSFLDFFYVKFCSGSFQNLFRFHSVSVQVPLRSRPSGPFPGSISVLYSVPFRFRSDAAFAMILIGNDCIDLFAANHGPSAGRVPASCFLALPVFFGFLQPFPALPSWLSGDCKLFCCSIKLFRVPKIFSMSRFFVPKSFSYQQKLFDLKLWSPKFGSLHVRKLFLVKSSLIVHTIFSCSS